MDVWYIPALAVISMLYLANMLLAYLGYRRMLRIHPAFAPRSLNAWANGAGGSAMMVLGLLWTPTSNVLMMVYGMIILIVGLVQGLQLCLMRVDHDPPDDPLPIDQPIEPPVLRNTRPTSPHHCHHHHIRTRRPHAGTGVPTLR